MDEILKDLQKALQDNAAVARYSNGYRAERKPDTALDKAVNQFKQAQEKRNFYERYFTV